MESAAHSPLNLKRKCEYTTNPDEVKRTKLQPTIKTEPQFEAKEFESTNNNNKTDEELIACDDGAEESFESDSEMLESKTEDVKEELDTSLEASSARCGGEARDEMFTNYQPWVLQTYGDLTKTKTITLKKYDRIVRTLKGLIPNVAENSKFRFWVRTKGFRLGPNGEDLFVASAKGNGEEIYKRVAVVEKFFDIIYSVHVDLEGRGGRHAGQKRTYKAITESFAFLPREAVTKYLLGCVDCQKRSDVEVPSFDLKTKHPFTPTQYDKANKQNPTLFELSKKKNNSDDKCNTLKPNSPKTKDETDNLTDGIYQENYELNEGHSFSGRPCTDSECLLRNNNSLLYDDKLKYTETISRTDHFNDTPKTSHVPINLTVRNCRLPLNVPKVDTVFNLKKLQFKKINLLNTLGEIEQTKKHKHTEDNSRLCTSTPEHFRNKSSSASDSTISKSSDYSSNIDISPIENEFQTFPKPYPKKLFTIHPTTFETIPIPLQQTDYGIYYEKTKPFLHPKIRKHEDKESDLLMESRPIMSAYLKHMRSLGYSDEDSLKIEAEVAIVSYNTRKVLYFGVKNKYCVICARAANKQKQVGNNNAVPKHICFKNWSGSSSSMESMAIVEGFMLSEEMYGVRYNKIIADGDSSVYTKILEYRPYDTIAVEKVECRNHLLRNYNNKLKEIASTSFKGDPADKQEFMKMRRALDSRFLRCRVAVTKAINHRKVENGSIKEKAANLRLDIINGPSHVFGEHARCKEIGYFCKGTPKEGEVNLVDDMKRCGIYQQIMSAVNSLADYSYHLIQDVDSNVVEQYNSVIAMYTGGKRLNQVQRNSYKTRCAAAVVQFNSQRPFYKLHKSITKSSPGTYAKLYEGRAKRKAENELKRRRKIPTFRRSLPFSSARPDKDYGPLAQKPDIYPEMFETKVQDHLKMLQKSDSEILELEQLTVNQSSSKVWLQERRLRLTASSFGLVCKRQASSSCGPVVTQLLYSKVDCAATRYGQAHEEDAVKSFETVTRLMVRKCGLFVDSQRPWLAASPDGLVGEDSLLEIKCPLSGKELTPEEVIKLKKGVVGSFWHFNKSTNSLCVNKKHSYFYQVQGQLQITKRRYCFFVLWTPLGVKIERVVRDDSFWKSSMVGKLEQFYFNCLLPEIIDPRRRRNMPLREPNYILEAQKNKKTSKKELTQGIPNSSIG